MTGHVYRVFDSVGRLLYIGSTGNPQNRFNCHRKSAWRPFAGSVSWDTYSTLDEARRREMEAIAVERPMFNEVGNVRGTLPDDLEVMNVVIPDLLRGAPGRAETVHDRKRAAMYLLQDGAA